MCGGYTTHSHDVPAVNTRSTVTETPAAAPTKQASRRIDAKELALQVAKLIDTTGKVVNRQDDADAVSISMVLRKGSIKATLEAAASYGNTGSSHVRVTKGRKVLLDAQGDGALNFASASFTPGSWTKPFRALGPVTPPLAPQV